MCGSGFNSLLLAAAVFCAVPFVEARSEDWTNVAGHVLKATPVACQGSMVTFKLSSGKEMDVQLSAFQPGSREILIKFLEDRGLRSSEAQNKKHPIEQRLRALEETGRLAPQDANAISESLSGAAGDAQK